MVRNNINIGLIWLVTVIAIFSCDTQDSNTHELMASFMIQSEEVEIDSIIHFIDTSTGTDENTDYLWDFGDGITSNSHNPTHIYTEIGEGNYIVTLTLRGTGNESIASEEFSVSLSNDIEGKLSLSEKLSDNEIIVCGHRSKNEEDAPENSLQALNNIISKGIEMIEIDIRETRDGKLVLMHDKTIDRTTNGTGNVADFTLEEIRQFRLFNDNGVLSDEKIPTLKEVLALARGHLYIDLDISSKASFEKVFPIVDQYGMLKQVLFYSSDRNIINKMIAKSPDIIAMPIIRDVSDFDIYEILNLKVVHFTSNTFNQTLVNKAKDKGWYIFMNAYINSDTSPEDNNYSQIDKLTALEGNIIQTDFPVLVNQYLN